MIWVSDTRNCAQCGALFTPRREHARFCSCSCRIAWNRDQAWDLGAEASALDWSVTAMGDATERLAGVRAGERPPAFAVISEAVWWVTIVDATLIRYHLETYEGVMAGQSHSRRALIEGTFGGLRFVRNQMGYYLDYPDFIEPEAARPGHDDRITAWSWRPMTEPAVGSLPPRGRTWEMARYRAYQAHLAGRTIGETFASAAAFLKLVSARTHPAPATGVCPAR
jgi:hypothetical protein